MEDSERASLLISAARASIDFGSAHFTDTERVSIASELSTSFLREAKSILISQTGSNSTETIE